MCSQARSQSPDGITGHQALLAKKGTLPILPCTVSQLLTVSQVSQDSFSICDWELHQVSVVGVVRGYSTAVTNVNYSVDDMTGPPLNVKQWVNTEDCAPMTYVSPGTYVKVIGSLRNSKGQRSLLAMDIHSITDLNEITSHMLEVVQAHMLLFGKMFDVNMNTTAASLSGRALMRGGGHPEGFSPYGLSTIQSQVLHVIRSFSVRDHIGISSKDLKARLDYLSMKDIRTSLTFLINEGHVFSTVDEHHFKSTEH